MVWIEKYIGFNKYSRPMTKMSKVRKIVVHYTANNGAGAMAHYNYFKNLSGRYASAHFMVDRLMALLIIPLNEMTYHANDGVAKLIPELRPNANLKSVGVEMCMEKNGTIHPDTVARTEDVVAELCKRFNLDPIKDVVRHYDITRKNCPAPWVANGSLFTSFKLRVNKKMKNPSQVVIDTTPLLSNGDSGEYVKDAQELLVKAGFKIVPDGHFGDATETALKEFQKDNKLDVDGYIGDATWKALKKGSIVVKPVINTVVRPAQVLDRDAKVHKIVSGDTFYSIAVYYAVGMKELQSLNPSLDVNSLKIGDVVKLKATNIKPVSKPSQKPVVKPVSKPVSKPVAKPLPKKIGDVVILNSVLNIRKDSNLESSIVGKAIKNSKFPVYEEKNGMLKIDEGKWVSASAKFVKFTSNVVAKPVHRLTLTYKGYLKKGDAGNSVKALQEALNHLNYNIGKVDGVYGSKTVDAVKRLQSVHLPKEVDGVAGQGTMKKINSLLK